MRQLMLRLFALALAAAMPGATLGAEPVVRAFTSILPVETFIERIGGERVSVGVMVGPGHSPATYDPRPRQIAELSRAQVYFRIGVPFESVWMARIENANPGMRVVDLREGIELRQIEAHDHGHGDEGAHDGEEHHGEGHHGEGHHGEGHHGERHHGERHHGEDDPGAPDPHVWTNPRNVIVMAGHIRDVLTELDPEGAALYRANHDDFVAELERLDEELSAMLADLRGRGFMVFHPAWGYLADAYGLEQIPIESQGRAPGAAGLDYVIGRAREEGIHVVLVQEQFSRSEAEAVARAIDGEVVSADPLAADYQASLRRVADVLVEALGR